MFKNIIFDWSGTISNDLHLAYEGSNAVLQSYGLPRISMEEYRREMELPYMNFYHKYSKEITNEKAVEVYVTTISKFTKAEMFADMKAVLNELKDMNKSLMVISSTPHEEIEEEIERYQIRNLFDNIYDACLDKLECLNKIIAEQNINKSEVIYIGDTSYDIQIAKEAGIKSIAVAWGYMSIEKLKEEKPDYIANNPLDIVEIIKTI